GAASAPVPYPTVPLPWLGEDGTFYHCCPMTIPLLDGRHERRVFVYWEPASLAPDVIEQSLRQLYELYSDPSWAPPGGTVLDLNATIAADLIAGVVKGSAFVVLDPRMT